MSVDFHRLHGKWRARISINRQRIELGYFATRQEAECVYQAALDTLAPQRTRKPRPALDPAARFFSKARRDDATGCLLWMGATDKDGYGKFQLNDGGQQTHVRAHRYAFFLRHGTWPRALALHLCDNATCVNADHLEDGDQGKNVRDCVARGRHRSGRVGRRRQPC